MAQISLTLPDNSIRRYEAGITAAEVAADIASSLAKKAISATVNGAHFDLAWPIDTDATIAIHTMKDEAQANELIRHDLAHIMARAVQEIWPNVQVTIGPVIKDGWYYDFDRKEPFTPEDLGVIEKKMKEIINKRDAVRTEDEMGALATVEGAAAPVGEADVDSRVRAAAERARRLGDHRLALAGWCSERSGASLAG